MSHSPEIAKSMADSRSIGRILVVDDDAPCRMYVSALLKKRGFTVIHAEGYHDAITKFQESGPDGLDCVITDYQMPDGNGIALLNWLKERDSSLGTIIITVEHERDLIAQSLRHGACDFLDKPTDPGELLAAVERAVALTRHRRHLEQSHQAVNQIGRLQQLMLQAVPGGALEIDFCIFPKHEAGGDSLTRIVLDAHRHLVLLTDVAGHDLKAAFLSAYFQGFVRGTVQQVSLRSVFESFDRILACEWNSEQTCGSAGGLLTSIAATALLLDLEEKSATILSCGAPLPVYISNEGRPEPCAGIGGPPLGWSAVSQIRSTARPVGSKGAFLMWSDGLEGFAEQQGVAPLAMAAALLLNRLGIRPVVNVSDASDDILAARVCLFGNTNSRNPEGFIPLFQSEYRPLQADSIDALQAQWSDTLLYCLPNITESELYNALLASREAVLNAFKHGCRNSKDCPVFFAISYQPSTRLIRIFVEDPGPGHHFDVGAHETVAFRTMSDTQKGLILIRNLASRWWAERNGASLILDFYLDNPAGQS